MEIKLIENTEKKLTIGVSGEVTTLNATELKSSILSFRENNPTGLLTFDFDELEYISSAGLRVIMMLLKSEKEKFHIINTSDEVFDTLYVTGFTGKIDIRKRIRKISIDGAKLIGKGANGDVMRLNADTVIKVYHPGTSTLSTGNRIWPGLRFSQAYPPRSHTTLSRQVNVTGLSLRCWQQRC